MTGPVGYANKNEKIWVLIAHFGAVAMLVLSLGTLAWVPPLVVLLWKGDLPVVRLHATESLNFQLTWAVATILSLLLAAWTCFGPIFYGFAALISVFALVFAIIGGVKASQGYVYHYPLSFRLIR